MTRKQIGVVCGAIVLTVITPLIVLAMLHAVGDTARAQPPASYTKVSMPDFGQHSQSWCWVGAAANSFWWYAENVAGQEGLLGGVPKPWKNIDLNSQNPVDPCWYDANDFPQGYPGPLPIPGYRQVLSMIAQTTFMDANQNGIQEAGEASYCYNQGVEKWDYLIGLRDYVNNYGSSLTVHDIIDPAKCGVGAGMIPTRQFPPTMNSLDPCGPGGTGVPGVNQVVLPPTFLDYQTELSNSQDVLLWMESTSPETAHVVTGVGYDTAPNPDTITISDPWTRNANPPVAPHDDTWNVSDPSHNNAPGHVPSPYDVCTVVNPGPAPKFTINCSGTIWTVYDMIFVSPATGADIKVLTFYSDPPGPFTFDVSTYNVINLFEDKHNNGPLDALVDVWWSMDLIEDRDGDGIPDINVRWLAEPGDLCTYQGAYVPCGEGGVAGVPWDPASLPSPPPVDTDSCLDDIDNDGDGTCDVNGCTAYPNSPDPDCQVDIDDIEFQITLPVSVETPVERPLMLHCKPRSDTQPYTLTLYNEEWPVEMEDPNPDNNFQELAIDVICQVADPHYKIYDIYDPDAPAVDEYVTLEDQFHTQDNVLVGYPLTLLPPAIKYVDGLYAGGGTAAPHLKCYAIEGMPPADATVNLTTQFGTETDIYVDMAGWLCVPALKEVTYPEPVPPPPPPVPLEPHYVCYDIWPAATPPTGLNIELETQFGIESGMTWESGGALCAPVIKRDNATGEYLGGNLTAPHLRCYGMYMTDDPPHIVNLFTQFPDEYDVDVNFAYAMCVPAEKEIVAEAEADKDVMAIIFDEADNYPIEGTELDPSNEFTIQASENEAFSVTSVEYNWGPDEPADAEISFYAHVPSGCDGRWLDMQATGVPDFPYDIQTIDGDYNVPSSGTTYFPPTKEPGPRWLDLHFQTAEYGLTEPVAIEDPGPNQGLCNDGIDNDSDGFCDAFPDFCGPGSIPDPDCAVAANAERYTRFFEIHCYEDADYVFEFCNRADVKSPDTDPDVTNNLRCATLTVHSQAPVEACCYPDVSCADVAPATCTAQGGTPLGPGSQCLGTEGCCDGAGTCIDGDAACCVNQGDTPQGSGSVCTGSQACCINGGATCTDCDGLCCDDLGGTLGGPVCLGDGDGNGIDDACEAAPAGVHYAAFSIFGGPPPPVPPVDLETQFGEELGVEVGPAVTLMAPALKNGEGTLDATHLKCYDILSSEDPFHLVDLTTQFGLEEDVEVGPARELCVPAAKEVVIPFPTPPGPLEPAPHYKCYEISGGPLGIPVELVTQFFSPEPVVILDVPTRLCAPALKNGEPGNLDDYPHLKCYDIPPGPPIGYIVNLETQFGLEPMVEVGEALRLCMPAVKDLVCQPTAMPPVDTDGDTFTDDIETYLPTDCLDDCTDNPGVHDAWPLDQDMNTVVNLTGDAIKYVGKIGCVVATTPECKRLDLDMNGVINLTGDAIKYVGHIGDTCT